MKLADFINDKYIVDFKIPKYLKKSILELESAVKNDSSLIDCYMDELYSDINAALVNDEYITEKQADIIRKRYRL